MNCLCGKDIKATFESMDDRLLKVCFYAGDIDIDGNQTRNSKNIDDLIEHRIVTEFSEQYLKEKELCDNCKRSANRLIMTHKDESLMTIAAMFVSKRLMHEITS